MRRSKPVPRAHEVDRFNDAIAVLRTFRTYFDISSNSVMNRTAMLVLRLCKLPGYDNYVDKLIKSIDED